MDVPRPRVRTRMSARAVRHLRPGPCGPFEAAPKRLRSGTEAPFARYALRKVAHHRTPTAAAWRAWAAVVASRRIRVGDLELRRRLAPPAPRRALEEQAVGHAQHALAAA